MEKRIEEAMKKVTETLINMDKKEFNGRLKDKNSELFGIFRDCTPSIATPESDAKLRKRYFNKGLKAKLKNKTRKAECQDQTSLIASWWFEGYDSV